MVVLFAQPAQPCRSGWAQPKSLIELAQKAIAQRAQPLPRMRAGAHTHARARGCLGWALGMGLGLPVVTRAYRAPNLAVQVGQVGQGVAA